MSRHFFDLSDVRDVERADEFAERTPRRRRSADTHAERKAWRDQLLANDAADKDVR